MNKRQHKHQIDVQTDEELVTVTIGSDGGVPGGFAKLFNRVIDSEAWARLSDAGALCTCLWCALRIIAISSGFNWARG